MKTQFRRWVVLGIGLLAVSLPFASNPVPAQAAGKFIVAHKLACPGANYTTIQAAIDAAPANNGLVTVCAGTYPEVVSITGKTNFKLVGKTGAVITIPNPSFNTVLVDVVSATNVTIQGFVIDGKSKVGTQNGATGIRYYLASGAIQNNTIKNWSTPSSATAANGMYSMDLIGTTGEKVKVVSNIISGFQDHAIAVTGRLAVTITKNTISGTSVSANDPHAIYVSYDGSGSPSGAITNNKVTSTAFPASSMGAAIYVNEASPFTISGNTVTHWGIGLQMLAFCGSGQDVDHNVVKANKFNQVMTGIILQTTPFYSCDSHLDFATVTGNKVTDTGTKGSNGIALVASWNGVLNAYAQNELIKGNTVKHFNTPYSFSVSEPQVFVSGIFAPNTTLP